MVKIIGVLIVLVIGLVIGGAVVTVFDFEVDDKGFHLLIGE